MGRPQEYAFILSHMRSGSSLLAHILASNPEILGYGESMTRYSTARDFDLLALKAAVMLRRFPLKGSERYLLDKLLHNVLLSPAAMGLLICHDVRLVFLLRSPEESIASLVRSLDNTREQAVQYYVDRLNVLHRYAEQVPRGYPAVVFTYHQLVHETELIFRVLRSILELRVPLSERYKLLPTTGQPGIGDFSDNIRAGRILRAHAHSASISFLNSEKIGDIEQARQAYDRCQQALESVCHAPGKPTS
jgi:hypothetical protein